MTTGSRRTATRDSQLGQTFLFRLQEPAARRPPDNRRLSRSGKSNCVRFRAQLLARATKSITLRNSQLARVWPSEMPARHPGQRTRRVRQARTHIREKRRKRLRVFQHLEYSSLLFRCSFSFPH